MVRKITKIQNESVYDIANKDTRYLRFITRKLLHSIEEATELFNNGKYAELEALEKTHNLLFGSKTSLASTLVILADLMIKLNQLQQSEDGKITEEKTLHTLSEHDVALVESFVKKLKFSSSKE